MNLFIIVFPPFGCPFSYHSMRMTFFEIRIHTNNANEQTSSREARSTMWICVYLFVGFLFLYLGCWLWAVTVNLQRTVEEDARESNPWCALWSLIGFNGAFLQYYFRFNNY